MENNNIQKPITMEINELKSVFAQAINQSMQNGLPMAVINMILKDLCMECTELEKQQNEVLEKQYHEALEKAKNDDKEEKSDN